MSESVLVEISDKIMLITINNTAAKNAVSRAVAEGIAEAIDELDRNPDICVGIVTGAGGTFCAGMDLKGFISGQLPVIPGRGFAGFTERPPKKPVIAAVEGYALAGGCELALACDLIVAADSAKFGIPEVKRGLVAGAGGLMRLPRQIPSRIAMEFALTGDFFDAQRAYEIGFINRICKTGKALETARNLALTIAANAPLAVVRSKRIIYESHNWTDEEMFNKQRAIIEPVLKSSDAIEGATAFAEKRAPIWKGK